MWYPSKREKLLSAFASQMSQQRVHCVQNLKSCFALSSPELPSGCFGEFCSFFFVLKDSWLIFRKRRSKWERENRETSTREHTSMLLTPEIFIFIPEILHIFLLGWEWTAGPFCWLWCQCSVVFLSPQPPFFFQTVPRSLCLATVWHVSLPYLSPPAVLLFHAMDCSLH